MKALNIKMMTLVLTFFFNVSYASDAAKVIFLKGTATSIVNGKIGKTLAKGDLLNIGDLITTGKASVLKIELEDKSHIQLGPNSSIEITKLSNQGPGIISLLKGNIRSQVTKDYMKIPKDKSKLFIKTASAAMGIRGTDFHVTYDPSSTETTLVTN